MQIRQPMHRSWSMRITPWSFLKVARTGHTFRQGASSQCMHRRGMKTVPPFSVSTSYTLIHSWSFVR